MVRSLSSATYCGWSAVEHDDAAYVDPKLKSRSLGRDCLKLSEEFIIQKGWASGEQITRWRAEAGRRSRCHCREGSARTIARSERGRLEGNLKPLRDTGRGMITYLEAIRSGLAKVLADDPRVFLYGQDIGSFGGAFKATKNLAKVSGRCLTLR